MSKSVVNPLNPFNEQEELSAPERELISTETTYCEQLTTLIDVFADPLNKWIINLEPDMKARQRSDYQIESIREDLSGMHTTIDEAIFSNIRLLLNCSKELLSALLEASSNGSKSIVMDTFRRHAPFLTMYSTYTSNFISANSLLQRLQLDPRFSAFIKCAELQGRCKGLTLPSFLILPVQRMPRYGLLIKEAIKMCSDETAIKLLTQIYQLTNSVTKRIDSKIEEQERRNKLIDVQSMLGIELLAPAREFIRDGFLTKICHSGRKDFYFVLCTDKLIYATESSGFLRSGQRYSVNKNYNLHDLLFVVPDDDNDINRSIFICSKDKAFEVEATSKDITNSWVQDIVKLKSRRTVQQLNAEKPWYQVEKNPEFSLYAVDRSSVIVNTYRIHSGADLTCGVIGFSEIVAVIVDNEPSVIQRPPSTSGYKRVDSSLSINSDAASERSSESCAPEIERRSSFTLLLKNAFGSRPSPANVQEKVRQAYLSEPIPILPFPSKDPSMQIRDLSVSSIPEKEKVDNEGDSDAERDIQVPSDPAPRLGQIGRMNSADFHLLGANIQGENWDSSKIQVPSVDPFIYIKPKLDAQSFVATSVPRPAMPTIAPPPIPAQSKGAVATTSSFNKVATPIEGSARQMASPAAKSTPSLPAPPPPAVNRKPMGVQQAALTGSANRMGSSKVVKAAVAKPKRVSRNTSDDGSMGSKSSAKLTSQVQKSSSKENSIRTSETFPGSLRTIQIETSVSSIDKFATLSSSVGVLPPPYLSERPKHESDVRNIQECKAMADAVADMHIDTVAKAVPFPIQRPVTANRLNIAGESQDGAIDPNAVVNQHILQVHGLD